MAKRAAAAGPVEGPWALPGGWRWARIGEVAPVNLRRTAVLLSGDAEVAFVPMAAVTAENGGIDVSARRPIDAVRQGFTRFEPGDVIFAKITPCMENGKIAVVPKLPHNVGFGSTEFHVLSPCTVSSRYLYHWVSRRGFRETAEFNMTGTAGQKRVPADFMREAVIPVPPRELQDVIVARIDDLFAEIEKGQAALARARDDLATWRKALLKAAVTGELTADWRTANPPIKTGADLLLRLEIQRRARWSDDVRNNDKRYVTAAGPAINNMPALPAGWTWFGVEQLTTGGIRNGLSLKEAPAPTAVKGLKLDALQPGGVDWTRIRYLPIDLERAAAYLLRSGDLLISRANGSPEFVGRCTMVDHGREDTVFPDTAIRYPIVNEPLLRTWVRLAWSAPQSRKRMLALAKSTAGILKISQADIAAVPLPLPPLAEIEEIATRVGRMTAEGEAGADYLASMKHLPTTLRQSILAAAFRGELA